MPSTEEKISKNELIKASSPSLHQRERPPTPSRAFTAGGCYALSPAVNSLRSRLRAWYQPRTRRPSSPTEYTVAVNVRRKNHENGRVVRWRYTPVPQNRFLGMLQVFAPWRQVQNAEATGRPCRVTAATHVRCTEFEARNCSAVQCSDNRVAVVPSLFPSSRGQKKLERKIKTAQPSSMIDGHKSNNDLCPTNAAIRGA